MGTLFSVVDNGFNWPEDAKHENGNYQCQCVNCKHQFIGHKRRVLCKRCANHAAMVYKQQKAHRP